MKISLYLWQSTKQSSQPGLVLEAVKCRPELRGPLAPSDTVQWEML